MPTFTPPRPAAEVNAEELRVQAMAMQCQIRDALVILQRLPFHGQRLRVGRYLLDANKVLDAWVEDGTMETSKGVL